MEKWRKKIEFSVFLVGILLLSVPTFSISFGSSLSGSNVAYVNKGESTIFKVNVFTLNDEKINVVWKASYPKEISVIVSPTQITLPPSENCIDCEWVAVGNGYVKSIPITIYVKVPTEISTNRYVINLNGYAYSGSENKITEGFYQTIVPSFSYSFVVYVRGRPTILPLANITQKEEIVKTIGEVKPNEQTNESNSKINLPTGYITLPTSGTNQVIDIALLILIIISLIVIGSVYLIKRRKKFHLKELESLAWRKKF